MLEKQKWIHFENDILTEWRQLKDEGRPVDKFEEVCIELSKQNRSKEKTNNANEIWNKMSYSSVDKEYPYIEPSDLDGIIKERPAKRHSFDKSLSEKQLRDKLTGAWLGRISGCLLGKPVEGYLRERLTNLLRGTDNYPMSRYITKEQFTDELIKECKINTGSCWADNINGIAPVDDDTNYTVFTLKLIQYFGKNFRPNDVLEAWLGWMPMLTTFTAERVAYRNAAAGMLAPETASYKNPYREWIGAQIRGDFFGYINITDTEKAAEMAWRDASISHIKNGIYGEMFVAAMISAAAVCDNVQTIIESGLDEIPKKSRLRKAIDHVIQSYNEGQKYQKVIDHIHSLYNEAKEHGWCHTIPNAMIVTAALLFGEKDLGKSICLAVEAAFDTDCNGATVGSIIGIMVGAKNIPDYWSEPYKNNLETSISGFTKVSVSDLVKYTIDIIKSE